VQTVVRMDGAIVNTLHREGNDLHRPGEEWGARTSARRCSLGPVLTTEAIASILLLAVLYPLIVAFVWQA
jgi:hypothetical protein